MTNILSSSTAAVISVLFINLSSPRVQVEFSTHFTSTGIAKKPVKIIITNNEKNNLISESMIEEIYFRKVLYFFVRLSRMICIK